jgi:hypothetical protein
MSILSPSAGKIRRTSIDSISHQQPVRHPAYYPVHPGYQAVLIYPPSLGAYGTIPTPSGQALPAPPADQTARNQTATSDDERPTAKLLEKKGRAGCEDGDSKSSMKKSKRAINAVSEVPTVVAATPIIPQMILLMTMAVLWGITLPVVLVMSRYLCYC